MSIALSVNLNKIALIRNSRPGDFPNLIDHANTCLRAGAAGITVHPRPDQRHIRPQDCHDLAELLQSFRSAEFNIEGNPFESPVGSYPGFMPLVMATKPDQVTLVPDASDQLTSDHGFDLRQCAEKLKPIIAALKENGCRVSLFMDPDLGQIAHAKEIGADRIELYTGPFAAAYATGTADEIFKKHCDAAEFAHSIGLGINAGHDLNLSNLPCYAQLPHLEEVSIGHALTVDALSMGLNHAVAAYNALCRPTEKHVD